MPKTSSDDILELTDIIEEGKLPEKNDIESNSESSFEDELDALFGDVEDLDSGDEKPKDPPIDPNEELDMPDMSDLDSLLNDLDGNEKTSAAPAPEDHKQVEGVDKLLADILPEAPADIEDVVEEVMPSKPEAAPAEDDIDAIMASLNQPAAPAPAPKAPVETPAEDSANDAASDIDTIFADLDQAAAPASVSSALDLDDEIAGAQESQPEPVETVMDTAPLEELDALIDDIMAPAAPATAGIPAPEGKNIPMPEEVPAAPPVSAAQPAAAPAMEQAAESTTITLDELAEKLAQGPLFAAIQNMIGQELDARVTALEVKLAENMDKAAAAAAAKIIREEIAAMLQEL